mmetsp:Transcript_17298/g.34513  ORF Transcript_17298/g.34513 Transcript_17298/m.34513 type:complete len:138 (+) Transcript_17298:94-507(+)|eukprot:CAMPEP_0181324082 /NCGR_PEP_ID=MMETSP1101-20121128/20151_1 /TAXON_ID=46948 /ORGANISM="Rhodomonas abbreviata, Strain Caron Lab Isolate" /LENGTH=137 /DNA_ID=CAMNT_0023432197 /DNA_START=92 /DNA_END=505 /DNA_ORIENTATION=-
MPKKAGGKKKAKEPPFLTDEETCRAFGFLPNDIVITPLGMEVVIIGVKKAEGDSGMGTMWAQFQGGYLSPLRPKNAIEFEEQGYRRAHEGIHILRNKALFETRREELLEGANPNAPKKEKKAKKGGKAKGDGKKKKK